MTWVRLDDGFPSNPKVIQLTDRQFRTWIRVLCHCSQAQDPTVDNYTIRELNGLTIHTVSQLESIGLLDKIGDKWEVHDWIEYQPKDPTNATRQAKYRAQQALRRNGEITEETVTKPLLARAFPSRPFTNNPFLPSKQPVDGKERKEQKFSDTPAANNPALARLLKEI
jgi:hypothetical protein